jgi:hypothetical protein
LKLLFRGSHSYDLVVSYALDLPAKDRGMLICWISSAADLKPPSLQIKSRKRCQGRLTGRLSDREGSAPIPTTRRRSTIGRTGVSVRRPQPEPLQEGGLRQGQSKWRISAFPKTLLNKQHLVHGPVIRVLVLRSHKRRRKQTRHLHLTSLFTA